MSSGSPSTRVRRARCLQSTPILRPWPAPRCSLSSFDSQTLSGSSGGLPQELAALLASHGYAALALAYFSYEHLPAELVAIPLEYFETGMRWLHAQQGVQDDRLG